MHRTSIVLLIITLAAPALAEPAKDPIRQAPHVLKPAEHGVGRLAPDIAFTDTTGKAGKLSDFKDKKAVVVLFTSTSCPVSQKYAPTLARLEKAYRDRGVAFVYVNPIATDPADDIAKAIKAHGFAGPYVHDKDGAFAKAIGAKSTTDAFVLDPARTVAYHGAVDDQYGLGYSLPAPKVSYLAPTLDAVLAGKVPTIQATEAHCVECHHRGGVAPFPMETYKDVVAHAGQIQKVVENETMPPWFAAKTES